MDIPRNIEVERQQGAEVVFRNFIDSYNRILKPFQSTDPNKFAKSVAEWLPTLLGYYDESNNAKFSLQILENLLKDAKGDTKKSEAILEGIYNASLRTTKKEFSSNDFYKGFLKSRRLEVFENIEESVSALGAAAPEVIWRYNGDYESELSLGIVKKEIKEAKDEKTIEALRRGLLVAVLVEIDFPEVRRDLEGNGVVFKDC